MALPRPQQRAKFDLDTRAALLENDVDDIYDDMHTMAKTTERSIADLSSQMKNLNKVGVYILISIVIGAVLAILNLVR